MFWTKLIATISTAVLVTCATNSLASEASEFGRSGPYVSGSGMYAFENFSGQAGAGSPDGSGGYNLRGGYRFNEYFAMEVAWEQYVDFSDSLGDKDQWIVGLNGKFYPFDGVVQPYLAAGMGYWHVNDNSAAGDDTGLGLRFGLGLDFYISRNWALTTEVGYLLPTGGGSDYQAIPLSLGVMYRFY